MPTLPRQVATAVLRRSRAAAEQAVWRRGEVPVLVFTRPKSGSTSVEVALRKASVPALKVHFFGRSDERARRQARQAGLALFRHNHNTAAVERWLATGRKVRAITLVRDPVASAVSAAFQTPELRGMRGAGAQAHLDRLHRQVERYAEKGALHWFPENFEPVTGVDLRAVGFDRRMGRSEIATRIGEVLLMRTDALADGAAKLSAFVGAPLEIGRANVRAQTREAEVYATVKKGLRLPPELARAIYDDSYVRAFFTDDQIAAMVARWSAD